jgi:HAD superfamily hydrolase (TIGR01509 family)
MAELHDLVMDEALLDVAPMPGAPELVAALRAAGIPVGVASNSPRDFLDRVLATSGMAGRFDVTVAGDEVVRPKPEPDVYLAACAALGAEPAAAVALEDSPTGAAAAKAAGMTVVGVPYLPDMAVPPADVMAGSLAEAVVYEACGLVQSQQ